MFESGFLIATARILRRVGQIYAAHVLLFAILVADHQREQGATAGFSFG
jgi:hypothetical protein